MPPTIREQRARCLPLPHKVEEQSSSANGAGPDGAAHEAEGEGKPGKCCFC